MVLNSLFDFIESGKDIDFELIESHLTSSSKLTDDLKDLKPSEISGLVRFFLEMKRFTTLSLFFKTLLQEDVLFNRSLIVLSLIKAEKIKSPEDCSLIDLDELMLHPDSNNIVLLPYKYMFSDKYAAKIESDYKKKIDANTAFKDDLHEQVAFLNNHLLTEKAQEIQNKIHFHFPEVETVTIKPLIYKKNPEDLKFSKVIERNLSFNNRSSKRTKIDHAYELKRNEETQNVEKLANLWKKSFNTESFDIFITQLEFLDLKSPDFYYSLLLKYQDSLDAWTKVYLYIKSERFFEGLLFLDSIENEVLNKISNMDSSENIYNFYYSKGIMYLGAGMNKEAEELFLTIKEQNEHYRDIDILLESLK